MATVSLSDLLKLSPAERMQLAQDLWDSIAVEAPEAVPVTEAQRQEVLRRSKAHQQNPDEAFSLDEALARIERSLG
jgi:putative addiction module component (TIGR02574 family)